MTHRAVILHQRPTTDVSGQLLAIETRDRPILEPGTAIVRNDWLGIDAGVLNRVRDEVSYVPPIAPGDVIPGFAVGKVIESDTPELPVDAHVMGGFGWQEFSLVRPEAVLFQLGDDVQPHDALGCLGLSGITAHIGIFEIGRVSAGDVVVVSAAVGGVGSLAGQLARVAGAAHVVGITSSPDKARYAVEELGYDRAVNRTLPEPLEDQLRDACPDGVDVYFDNAGGDVADALLPLYKDFARIVVCGRAGLSGRASTYGDVGQRDFSTICVRRMTKRGFLVFDHLDRFASIRHELSAAIRAGHLRVVTTVSRGIDTVPDAVDDVLQGRSIGKQIVELGS